MRREGGQAISVHMSDTLRLFSVVVPNMSSPDIYLTVHQVNIYLTVHQVNIFLQCTK